MPYAFTISPDQHLARVRLIGAVEGREITAAWHAVVSAPAWEQGFASLWDATGIHLHILLDDVEAFSAGADEHARLRGPGRTAIVTSDVSVHINALLLCLKSKGGHEREFRIFQCVAEAEAWLAEATACMAAPSERPASMDEPHRPAPEPPPAQWGTRSGYLVRVATNPGDHLGPGTM